VNKPIRVSSLAESQLLERLGFLEKEWGSKTKISFLKRLDQCIQRIQRFPSSSPRSRQLPTIRVGYITRQTALLYEERKQEILIFAIRDSRKQLPDQL
jgi:plasmid stabilization system protein ParE